MMLLWDPTNDGHIVIEIRIRKIFKKNCSQSLTNMKPRSI